MYFCDHIFLILLVSGMSDALAPYAKQLAKYPTCGIADFQNVRKIDIDLQYEINIFKDFCLNQLILKLKLNF